MFHTFGDPISIGYNRVSRGTSGYHRHAKKKGVKGKSRKASSRTTLHKKAKELKDKSFNSTDELLSQKWVAGMPPNPNAKEDIKLKDSFEDSVAEQYKSEMKYENQPLGEPELANKPSYDNKLPSLTDLNQNRKIANTFEPFTVRTHLPFPIYFSDGSPEQGGNQKAGRQSTAYFMGLAQEGVNFDQKLKLVEHEIEKLKNFAESSSQEIKNQSMIGEPIQRSNVSNNDTGDSYPPSRNVVSAVKHGQVSSAQIHSSEVIELNVHAPTVIKPNSTSRPLQNYTKQISRPAQTYSNPIRRPVLTYSNPTGSPVEIYINRTNVSVEETPKLGEVLNSTVNYKNVSNSSVITNYRKRNTGTDDRKGRKRTLKVMCRPMAEDENNPEATSNGANRFKVIIRKSGDINDKRFSRRKKSIRDRRIPNTRNKHLNGVKRTRKNQHARVKRLLKKKTHMKAKRRRLLKKKNHGSEKTQTDEIRRKRKQGGADEKDEEEAEKEKEEDEQEVNGRKTIRIKQDQELDCAYFRVR